MVNLRELQEEGKLGTTDFLKQICEMQRSILVLIQSVLPKTIEESAPLDLLLRYYPIVQEMIDLLEKNIGCNVYIADRVIPEEVDIERSARYNNAIIKKGEPNAMREEA